jgi:antitoxin component of MazEF toxin-antitoxin module
MIEIRAELKQWGNSYGIRIPKSVAEKAGLKKGDVVSVPLKKETFAISDFFWYLQRGRIFRTRARTPRQVLE